MYGRTLIIGISGFLGSHIVASMRRSRMPVIGLAPRPPADALLDDFFAGRSETTDLVDEALEGCENVIYLGGTSRPALGMTRISDEIDRESNHVIDLAELCAKRGIKRFVFASSGGTVYGLVGRDSVITEQTPTMPISTYGLAKLVVEHGLRLISRRTGMVGVSLRVSNPYGPRQYVKAGQGFIAAACGAAVNGTPLKLWGDGSIVRDFLYVDDVADAFVQSLTVESGFELLNIGSGEGHSLIEVCRRIEAVGGTTIDIRFEPGRPVDTPNVVLSNQRAVERLDWRPKVPLDQGLARTLAWWEAQRDKTS